MAEPVRKTAQAQSIPERVDALDWKSAQNSLSQRGYAVTPQILSPEECRSLAGLYSDSSRFRSHIVMERFRFGVGDYQYFAHPLPEIVSELRTRFIPISPKLRISGQKPSEKRVHDFRASTQRS